jgi:hypothetical protein
MALIVIVAIAAPIFTIVTTWAADLAGETFTGISTPANAWVSGGSGGSVACLTAATSSAANSIPACPSGPIDTVGNGVLRLTPAANTRSGFAIYNTPVSASDGLNIEFTMYQWGGTNADGISFFLIDGAANPTQPGAAGGALGYASSTLTPGIDGGYVGVGFDRFGNFSNSDVGGGGPGPQANTIGIRGSEASGYDFVTNTPADGSLSGTTRTNSARPVKINISTNNIMSVAVNYGSGYVTELSGIDLNSINGEDSMPANFKFGFAASTGGSTNNHEIRGLTVETNPPSASVSVSHTGNFVQGSTGEFTLDVSNDSAAEATDGLITVQQTLPAGFTPIGATGTGWTCEIDGQDVTCTRPGDGGNALAPGTSTPDITVTVAVASNATTPLNTTATVDTPGNSSEQDEDSDSVTVLAGSYLDNDGVFNDVEAAAPNSGDGNNDGDPDSEQDNVTSIPNSITGNYTVLEADGCTDGNNDVSLGAESANPTTDGSYTYPAGLLAFELECATPGDTATVVQYFYGTFDPASMVARKYDAADGTYQNIPGAVLSSVTIAGQAALKIEYQITDGGPLDQDGLADGTIVDPAGPAVLAGSVTAPTPGAPNTGLATQSTALYYIAGAAGIGLVIYATIRGRRLQKAYVAISSRK